MIATVWYNHKISSSCYKLGLRCGRMKSFTPGQFLMLRIADQFDPLLRRPFGIYRIVGQGPSKGKEQGIEILYKVVGKGTKLMTLLTDGDRVDVLCPLGNGFPLAAKGEKIIMVAGGIGIVPFYTLGLKLMSLGIKPKLLFGGRNKEDLPGLDDFKRVGMDMALSTDDGSVGNKGFVTELLKKEISKGEHSIVYACGPVGMLKEVAGMTKKAGVLTYVSLESRMACGMGACLGCAVKVKGQGEGVKGHGSISDLKSQIYKMVCKDGPVFDAKEIAWEEI